jgi:hypothetical protein
MYTLTKCKNDVKAWMRQYPEYTRREAIEAVAEHMREVRFEEETAETLARTEARYEGSTFNRASR